MKKLFFVFLALLVFSLDAFADTYDDPPVITDGPRLAAGWWPLMSTSPESPMVLKQNYSVLWTFSDDYASCSGACTHSAKYQVLGSISGRH